MVVGTERIREIVLSLRNFSRLDEAAAKTVDLHEGIDSTLNHLEATASRQLPRTTLFRWSSAMASCPQVGCYPSQLNQVFMNILANAIDALDECTEPRLTITTATKRPPSRARRPRCHYHCRQWFGHSARNSASNSRSVLYNKACR